MRFYFGLLPLILLASCVTAPRPNSDRKKPDQAPAADSPAPQAAAIPFAPPPPAAPSTPAAPTRLTNTEISGIRFEGVAFDSRKHRLVVVDQAKGPGSRFPDAASAASSVGGVAAVNAGFFTPEGAPLGLVVSDGESSGGWNSASSLGSGVWYESPGGSTAISRREKLGRSAARTMRELLQTGPMLVDGGKSVGGLDATKTSARSFILWDGGTRWWMGRASPCSLAALGNALGRGQPAGWKVREALNLDGGRSADLWVSSRVPGGPLTRRSFLNRPVRNFLVLVPHG